MVNGVCVCVILDLRWGTACLNYAILTEPGFEPRPARQSQDLDRPHLGACLIHRPYPSGHFVRRRRGLEQAPYRVCTLRRRHTIQFLGAMTSGTGLELSGTGMNNLPPFLGLITGLRDTVWGGGKLTVRVGYSR